MARIHGKDATLSIDDSGGTPTAFTAETVEMSIGPTVDTHDTTTMGDSWDEFTAGLKRGGDFSFTGFFNDTNTTGLWALLTSIFGSTGTVSIVLGSRTVSFEALCNSLPLQIQVADMVKTTAGFKVTGAVTFS